MPYKDKNRQRQAVKEASRRYRKRRKQLLEPCKVTIKDMEDAIKQLESEGYTDLKVVDCPYWQSEHEEAKPE